MVTSKNRFICNNHQDMWVRGSPCSADHSVFIENTTRGKVILAIYVDDILLTGSDSKGIQKIKERIFTEFMTKDLGLQKYFVGIEVLQSRHGIVLSQIKYALHLLEETRMTGCKPVDTPMDANTKLCGGTGEDVGAPGRGLLYKNHGHFNITGFSDANWAGSPDDRKSTSGFFTVIGGNLVTWKSKNQNVVARSSIEVEYRAMAHTVSELLWVRSLLAEFGFYKEASMEL
ncbi:uncharacterized mitochondrial protein AtMg00810-like [Aristolochia californica]|uniref:uncharacterized mitochondrial protein AtMg00810-like n=1 Tax=Aristolochia californica TaxID=171875 RepID=UPI0035E157D3